MGTTSTIIIGVVDKRGVYTHIHDLIKGTLFPPPRSSASLEFTAPQHEFRSPSNLSQDARFLSGRLPKLNFSKFDGDNPKL
jgi:hypothetical protein